MNRTELASMIDHTLLRPESTDTDVAALVEAAKELGVKAVCVSPARLPLSDVGEIVVATVCGFPSGAVKSEIKAAEAARAASDGAQEVDMVIDVSTAVSGDYGAVEADIREVRDAMPAEVLLKVIIESATLTDAQIVGVCEAAERAGAQYVKTSTGFHPAGGASVHAVRLMAQTVGGRLGVKASGGIRTAADALAMVEAGATRLGLSASAAILAELGA